MAKYIYQYDNWPHFIWNEKEISQNALPIPHSVISKI